MEMKYANDEWKVRDMESSQFYDNDAEREVSELPYIADHDELEKNHSPLLTSWLANNEAEAPGMEVQAERIGKIYESTPELHYDKWKFLDINERKGLINNFERQIALIEKRPPMPVVCEELSDGMMGYNNGKKIAISEKVMNGNLYSDYKNTMNTLFHEGRHSYQNYNLYVKRTESSDEAYNSWLVNRQKLGYSSGDTSFPFNLSESFRQKNFYKYYTQPVEVDARLFAETVENKIGLNAG